MSLGFTCGLAGQNIHIHNAKKTTKRFVQHWNSRCQVWNGRLLCCILATKNTWSACAPAVFLNRNLLLILVVTRFCKHWVVLTLTHAIHYFKKNMFHLLQGYAGHASAPSSPESNMNNFMPWGHPETSLAAQLLFNGFSMNSHQSYRQLIILNG